MTAAAPATTTALRMPRTTLERLADATCTPLPWHASSGAAPHEPVPAEVADALATFRSPDVLVQLTASLRLTGRPGRVVQLTTWQRLHGDRVTAVSAVGADTVELAWFGAHQWPRQLARAVAAGPADDLPRRPLPDHLHAHLDARLDARLDALLTGRADPRLRRPLGRLLGTVAGRRGVGWVSALRFADGWCALTPYVDHGVPAVHVRRVRPERLAAQLAVLALGARP